MLQQNSSVFEAIVMKILLLVTLFLVMAKSKAALVCPDGWKEFDNFCYKVMENYLYPSTIDWLGALRLCLGMGGNLVSIANEVELEFVKDLSAPTLNNRSAWIGLVYLSDNGDYVWSDGRPVNSSVPANWLHGNPVNETGNVFCADLWRSGFNFTRCGCKENQHYICKRPKGPKPCPVNWILDGSSCYKASKQIEQWNDALSSCLSLGGYLAEMDGAHEQRFIADYMNMSGFAEQAFHVWVNEKRNKKCVQITTSGEKKEDSCEKASFYICEQSPLAHRCYERPSNTSTADCSVNCTHPENLCFKHSYKGEDDPVTIQGCMSADQCSKNQSEDLKCCESDFCNKEISCYECSSNISFDDCTKKQTLVDCPIPVHGCAKMEIYKGVEGEAWTTFHKGCATLDQCKPTIDDDRIAVCCGDDQCNTDSELRCYECSNAIEECPVHQCIFNDGKCYYAQGSNGDINKYGCTQEHLCDKPAADGYFRRCCSGNLCNEVKDQQGPTENLPSNNNNTRTYILIAVTFILLLFLSLAIGVYCYRKSHYKKIKSSPRTWRDIVSLDKWEILPEQIEYEEELGRGAFGVVHKAKLNKRVGIEVFDTRKQLEEEKRKKAFQVVAVKVLKDNASEAQNEEFMSEIEQMKLLGYHQNIVSLVGCSTLFQSKFLVIEYVPFGDLLQWLRRRRRMINQSEGKNGEKSYDDKDILEDRKGTTTFDQESHNDKDQFPEKIESVPIQDINDTSVVKASEVRTEESHTDKDQFTEKMELIPVQDINDISVVISLPSEMASEKTARGNPPDEGLLSIPTTSQQDNHAAAKIIFSDDFVEEGDDEDKGGFTTNQLFCFAWQIARGMNHLAENGFVHRDLAARNVLVGRDNKVKLSDFGLMRQIYEDVYSSEKTKKLPVKWMAPESLYEGIYTIKSDVWSFGVLLWEMATLGGVPYPTLTNSELYQILNTGYRMDRPDMCCDEVHDLMTECWREEPSNRPSFFDLIEKIELLMQKDVPYLDVNKHDEASPYYNVPTQASAVEESKL